MLLYWFAAQQQISAIRRQKSGLFYLKFSAEFKVLISKSNRKCPKTAKTKIIWKKTKMRVFRGLRVKTQAKTGRGAPKEGSFVIF